MPKYEITLIIRQDLSPQDADKILEQYTGVIKDNSGKIAKTECWGLRNLAYLINKNRKGHYKYICTEMPVETLKELDRQLGLNEDILRHLVIKVDEFEKGNSFMLKQDDRDAA